mgnify:CR=1 FL=1
MIIPYFSGISLAQSAEESAQLNREILHYDSIFWKAYNTCDLDGMRALLTDDIEFYHDKNGAVAGLDILMEGIGKGLCGNENMHLRREEVPGSLHIYPMNNYGAILMGEHVFYVVPKGKEEFLDGYGKFTHLWKKENGTWKMARIYSYDHGPAIEKLKK